MSESTSGSGGIPTTSEVAAHDTADRADPALESDEGVSSVVVERASMKRNIAQMTSSQVATWVIATVSSLIVPRYLGPTLQGRMQVALSLWLIADIFMALGTDMYLRLQISRDQRQGLRLVAPIMLLRTLAFFVAAGAIGVYVTVTDNGPDFGAIVALYGVAALFTLWSSVFISGFVGLEVMSTVAKISAGMRVVGLVAIIAVVVLDGGIFGILWVHVAVTAATLALFGRRFRRLVDVPITGWSSRLKPALFGSLPFMAVGLALVVYRQIDVIVISQVAGERDVGWYASADLLAGSMVFPTTVIMASAFPTMGRLHAEDPGALRHLVRRMFSLLMLVGVPIGLGATVIAPTFTPLLLGSRYDGAGQVLAILGPVTILGFATTLIAHVALATGRNRFMVIVLAACAAATIPLDLVLVPWAADRFDNGAIGGAIAFVFTEVGQFLAGIIVITPYLIDRSIAWRSLRVLAAGLIMLGATWPFRDQLFLVPVVVGAVVYPIAVLLLRVLDAEQRALIGDALARVGLRTRWAAQSAGADEEPADLGDARSPFGAGRPDSLPRPMDDPLAAPYVRDLPPTDRGSDDD
jgi:O-antigen/teichoic acid export membrane protein